MSPQIVQAALAPAFLLIGLSHLLQPQLWIRFFDLLRSTGLAAAIIAMYTLPVAMVLVVGHNVWVFDWPVFLTIAGWLMLAKSALYLLIPAMADRMLEKQVTKTSRGYQIAGAIMILVGGVLTYRSWF